MIADEAALRGQVAQLRREAARLLYQVNRLKAENEALRRVVAGQSTLLGLARCQHGGGQ